MRILSHRGFWVESSEKNTAVAFTRSLSAGFGIETDIRDYAGELVISHDIPNGGEMSFLEFLGLASSLHGQGKMPLALNIKSDGLAQKVNEGLSQFPNLDFFAFDMAVPDMRAYLNAGIPVFTRMSEVERHPVCYEQSAGIWLDGFESEWFDRDLIVSLLAAEKRVCLVSPELHGRNKLPLWRYIADLRGHPGLMICTDYPLDAKHYFCTESKDED